MTKNLRALLERKEKLIKESRALLDAVAAENRLELTEEEQQKHSAAMADLDKVNAGIAREQQLIEMERSASAVILPDGSITGGAPRIEQDPKHGFNSYGEFLQAVANHATKHIADPRLAIGAAAPTTYGNEGTGADGGFAVPPEFGREIFSISLEGESLLALTDNDQIGGNSMTYPADETTPWGSTGIIAAWDGEAAVFAQRKPSLEPRNLRMNKLTCLVPMTDELLADAPAMSGYVMRKTSEAIRYKSNDAIINGNGVGMPLGIFNSGALESVAKEGSQAADTLVTENITKMFARNPMIADGVWLLANDAFPQIITLKIGDSPIWTPPNGGLRESPTGRLLGRPLFLSQHCKTLGDKGDTFFFSPRAYKTITKRGGIETATSMHIWFDAGVTAFRAIFRLGGQPHLRNAITQAHGGAIKLSPYVTLDERA